MLLILLGGMLLKDIFKDLIKGMQGHYILLIMRVITDLRIKHTEKNNGLEIKVADRVHAKSQIYEVQY